MFQGKLFFLLQRGRFFFFKMRTMENNESIIEKFKLYSHHSIWEKPGISSPKKGSPAPTTKGTSIMDFCHGRWQKGLIPSWAAPYEELENQSQQHHWEKRCANIVSAKSRRLVSGVWPSMLDHIKISLSLSNNENGKN